MAEITFNKVPGMTEPVEQKMLYEISKNVQLNSGDVFYEFGPFFGRSTYYMADGLRVNTNKGSGNKIHTYDVFACPADGFFAPHVHSLAKASSVSHLLVENEGVLDFSKVFEHYRKSIYTGKDSQNA